MAHVLDNRLFQKPCRLEVDLDTTVTKFVSIVPQIERTMIEEAESMECVSDIPIHTMSNKELRTTLIAQGVSSKKIKNMKKSDLVTQCQSLLNSESEEESYTEVRYQNYLKIYYFDRVFRIPYSYYQGHLKYFL